MEAKIEQTVNIRKLMRGIGENAREASRILSLASADQKESALHATAASIRQAAQNIAAANESEMHRAASSGLHEALLDRLSLNSERIEAMAKGLEAIASLRDPV